jgi:hypothetical protein
LFLIFEEKLFTLTSALRFVALLSSFGNVFSKKRFVERGFGIEIRPDLINVAKELIGIVRSQSLESFGMGDVRLIVGDVRAPSKEVLEFIRNATIVFVNNVVFDEELKEVIVRLLAQELREGSRVVSFRDFAPRQREASKDPLLSRFHFPPFRFESEINSVSWTASQVPYFIYTIVPPNPVTGFNAWYTHCVSTAFAGMDHCVAAENHKLKRRKRSDAEESPHGQIAALIAPCFMDLYVDGKAQSLQAFRTLTQVRMMVNNTNKN